MRIKPSHVYIFDDKEKLLGDRVREETIFSLFSHSLSPSRCLVILIDRSGVGNWKDWIEEQKKKKKKIQEKTTLFKTPLRPPPSPLAINCLVAGCKSRRVRFLGRNAIAGACAVKRAGLFKRKRKRRRKNRTCCSDRGRNLCVRV